MSASLKSICLSINKEDKILKGGAVAEWSEAIIMRENKRKLKDLIDKQSNDSGFSTTDRTGSTSCRETLYLGPGVLFWSASYPGLVDAQGIVGDENNLLQPWSHDHLG